MTPLPTGTVTFLFTDIEGSTALWERDREAMQAALERHDGLLRDTRANRSSMAEDLARGRRTEADAILGSASRAGREARGPTPVIDALLALMNAAESRAR